MSRQVIEDTIHQHLRHHLPRLRLGKKSLFCGFSHSHMCQRLISPPCASFKIKRLSGSAGQGLSWGVWESFWERRDVCANTSRPHHHYLPGKATRGCCSANTINVSTFSCYQKLKDAPLSIDFLILGSSDCSVRISAASLPIYIVLAQGAKGAVQAKDVIYEWTPDYIYLPNIEALKILRYKFFNSSFIFELLFETHFFLSKCFK